MNICQYNFDAFLTAKRRIIPKKEGLYGVFKNVYYENKIIGLINSVHSECVVLQFQEQDLQLPYGYLHKFPMR